MLQDINYTLDAESAACSIFLGCKKCVLMKFVRAISPLAYKRMHSTGHQHENALQNNYVCTIRSLSWPKAYNVVGLLAGQRAFG